MSTHLWNVIAKRDVNKIAKGMSVEIVIRNASRKPNQKEVIEAFNAKYGAGTALSGLSISVNFEIVEVK
ncbi:peptidase [Riemerella anatipestifer]|uniref:peptidase n=1 Tax=Riemerella anatipestifer TaxID=34085 RepID=UPI00129EF4CB|nr:peptidase [Riemerella anatipestifer]MRM83694.1 peptidase [Riemerella anatipestifer]